MNLELKPSTSNITGKEPNNLHQLLDVFENSAQMFSVINYFIICCVIHHKFVYFLLKILVFFFVVVRMTAVCELLIII
jgi:hypothetical protein